MQHGDWFIYVFMYVPVPNVERNSDGDYGAETPPNDLGSFSKKKGVASAPNTGQHKKQKDIGARVAQEYKLKVVTDMKCCENVDINVKSEAVVTFSSSGTIKIKNEPGLPAISVGLSASWGIISFNFGGGVILENGRSAAGTAVQGYIEGNTSNSSQKTKNSDDVGWTWDVAVEKAFSVKAATKITDSVRKLKLNVTEVKIQNRVDCLSSIAPGTIGTDSNVLENKQTLEEIKVAEKDDVYEIVETEGSE